MTKQDLQYWLNDELAELDNFKQTIENYQLCIEKTNICIEMIKKQIKELEEKENG